MHSDNDKYYEIRPYKDDEIQGALERLINDDEFISAILKYRFPKLVAVGGWLLKPLLKSLLKKKWSNVRSVRDAQMQVATYMEQAIKHSSDGVTYSGIEKLDPNKAYLFVSNHRDIAMDPALVNWGLHLHNRDTVRIAIGDNLLKKPCATELMRLNKSFIVKRSAKGPREMMKALGLLSSYIKDSLEEGQSIWIAQKEGRAKDGNDVTDPAILKMFHVNGRAQKIPFGEYMASLNIVPVTISYENDPCDLAKASELFQTRSSGAYEKAEFEDIESIVRGIVGQKRRIHVAFGDVVTEQFDNADSLAKEIDRQIHANYHLFPVNYIAADKTHESVTQAEQIRFTEKLSQISQEEADIVRHMYAQPVEKAVTL
ncbi:1-acyl-sn-glycerol-3-phosphate acyltransferase [Parasalinivibrio latis]|uniref:1-acyl-sn-glycerol-3-phosphate acyltransferase n=1 Tax=Parasalinivibrio latis TaxID=2952610 RepID=UPI0030E42553